MTHLLLGVHLTLMPHLRIFTDTVRRMYYLCLISLFPGLQQILWFELGAQRYDLCWSFAWWKRCLSGSASKSFSDTIEKSPEWCRTFVAKVWISLMCYFQVKKGDSGGPLIQTALVEGTPIEWLVGVVSFGVGCARPGLGGAYSSIDYYSQWIADTVNHFKANHQ